MSFKISNLPIALDQSVNGPITSWSPNKWLAQIAALLSGGYRSWLRITASFTRPSDTTAYASGDLVANSTVAGSVVPIRLLGAARNIGGQGIINRLTLGKTGTTLTNAQFRVHFYLQSPTVSNGDNGAWISNAAGYLGSVDVTIDKAFSAGSQGYSTITEGNQITFTADANTKDIYALVEARGAYTPASGETFTLAVRVEQR